MTLDEIELYTRDLEKREMEFKNQTCNSEIKKSTLRTKMKSLWEQFSVVLFSIYDFTLLMILLKLNKSFYSDKRFVYTAKNLCTLNNGVLEDRIVKPIFTENIVFISHAREYKLDTINNQKVFNIGGVVKLLARVCFWNKSLRKKYFLAYKFVNNCILCQLDSNEVYTLCYYDLNGISLAFSDYRANVKLGEIQHGSIINYPPYAEPAPFKILDVFYVKNVQTITYLQTHLCRNFEAEYKLIPYPEVDRKVYDGVHVFYASTVEFNGFHPVFESFLKNNNIQDLHVIVRLHPREKEKKNIFRVPLEKYNVNFEFDDSKNWLENNKIKNLIVISPWSSSIEDSFDNGFITITIDPVGKQRYEHLIDNRQCFYSSDLNTTIDTIVEKAY